MGKKIITKEGDVFAVPLDEHLYGYGQIAVIRPWSMSMITFEHFTPQIDKDVKEIAGKSIIHLFGTADFDIRNRRWKLIGNTTPPRNLMLPTFKVTNGSGRFELLSSRGLIIREITAIEASKLENDSSCTPNMLKKALQAYKGIIPEPPWIKQYIYKPQEWWELFSPPEPGYNPRPPIPSEQAVKVSFNYGSKDLSPIFELEEALKQVLEKPGVGDYDGNEVATDGSDGFLYMYGPDADKLFAVVEPLLKKAKFMKGARVTLRYGEIADNAPEKTIILG